MIVLGAYQDAELSLETIKLQGNHNFALLALMASLIHLAVAIQYQFLACDKYSAVSESSNVCNKHGDEDIYENMIVAWDSRLPFYKIFVILKNFLIFIIPAIVSYSVGMIKLENIDGFENFRMIITVVNVVLCGALALQWWFSRPAFENDGQRKPKRINQRFSEQRDGPIGGT